MPTIVVQVLLMYKSFSQKDQMTKSSNIGNLIVAVGSQGKLLSLLWKMAEIGLLKVEDHPPASAHDFSIRRKGEEYLKMAQMVAIIEKDFPVLASRS